MKRTYVVPYGAIHKMIGQTVNVSFGWGEGREGEMGKGMEAGGEGRAREGQDSAIKPFVDCGMESRVSTNEVVQLLSGHCVRFGSRKYATLTRQPKSQNRNSEP